MLIRLGRLTAATKTTVAIAALGLALTACGGGDGGDSKGDAAATGDGVCASTDAKDDLLAEICANGEIRVSTDPAYPPQSSLNEETGEFEGFDIDVATEIADRLGVEIAWEEPSWEVLTSGSWNDRWDMSVGSMSPTNERQEVLDFTQPYAYTPAVAVVNEENTSINDLSTDLDGKKIGTCAGCSYENFLNKTLAINGYEFDFVIDEPTVKGYDTDTTALQDLSLGDGDRLDAVLTSITTADGYIKSGQPVKVVGEPMFYEPVNIAFDKASSLSDASLLAAVDKIVGEMHADGTMTELSKKWYDGVDITSKQ